MRNRFFLWVVSALLLFAGCTSDEIVEEQPTPEVEGSTLVITASAPMNHHKPVST
jgi:multidrug efflux pump subunit AcrB